ncbi:DedA family protein [Priestia flexa]|jgi:membrane protein DedA with SNARE-associated domain|uniref:DedA family protein n=1 Tax=Priestia flexa TaxID=86664 RepID=UPI0009565719|nr:DedA family protein [Priestia flexa]MBY6087284.1 DedA family protein [Priestia flexa]MEC0666393.1 DedA family protein [Priestia flexa]MED3825058.1 DedA family protein [Priestia flexa]WEZ06886.1 DedA family protein [Priestia flexa]SIR25310.1 membrane protein DedA, SNARE-associated domain [Priestia flexa]
MQVMQDFIMTYGYLAIFLMLTFGIIGLPVPDEVMMTTVGYFTNTDVLNYGPAVLFSFCGALLGMIVSYTIGRKAGRPFINRYGKWIGLKEKRMKKVESWMMKYGPYSIILAYFIPGVRHLVCYFSGIGKMKLQTYITFAAIGAFLWCFVFITFGKLVGIIQ